MPELDFGIVATRIKEIMKNKRITQNDIAENISDNQSNISKYLKGDVSIPLNTLFKICCYLGVSMDEITGLNNYLYSNEDISLSNVCEALSNLNDMASLCFGEIKTDKTYNCIYSRSLNIDSTISKFSKIIEVADGSAAVFNSWKKDFMSKNRNRLKKYAFNTKEEIIEKNIKVWIDGTVDYAAYYKQNKNPVSYVNREYDDFIIKCEEWYSPLNKSIANLMYNAIDGFIAQKQILEISCEYISLMAFKTIHEKVNKINE